MRRSPSKSWRHQKELLVPRQSTFARFSGIITQKKKQLGNDKMNSEKTTRTYLLANPNLEGEIHLKRVRLVTSQNFKIFKVSCMHSSSFPCIKNLLNFVIFKVFFELNQIGGYFQKFSIKIRKRKEKRKRKGAKGHGRPFGPWPEMVHGPAISHPNRYLPPLFFSR
jgi:hypothetical protein